MYKGGCYWEMIVVNVLMFLAGMLITVYIPVRLCLIAGSCYLE